VVRPFYAGLKLSKILCLRPRGRRSRSDRLLYHWRRRRWRNGLRLNRVSLLSLSLSLGFDRVCLMYGFLETFNRLADSFTKLRQLPCPENDQHDEQDQNQLCKT